MHAGGGSFTPGQGLPWELFSKALALYAPVILSKKVSISTEVGKHSTIAYILTNLISGPLYHGKPSLKFPPYTIQALIELR